MGMVKLETPPRRDVGAFLRENRRGNAGGKFVGGKTMTSRGKICWGERVSVNKNLTYLRFRGIMAILFYRGKVFIH